MPAHSPTSSLVVAGRADALGCVDAGAVDADPDNSSAWLGLAHAASSSAVALAAIRWFRMMISSVSDASALG
jgi:hypothetical protein